MHAWFSLGGAAIVAAVAAASSAQTASPQGPGWLPAAQSLVRQEQPVGVVLRDDEAFGNATQDGAESDEASVTRSNRGSVARLLSKRAQRCQAALRRPLVALRLRGAPLAVLQDLVLEEPGASLPLPPGIVGGAVGPGVSRRGDRRLAQHVELRVEEDDTLESAFDRLVTTGMPLGWGVIEHDADAPSPCAIVLLTEDTVLVTPYDAVRRGGRGPR